MFTLYSARIRFTLFFGPSAGFWGGARHLSACLGLGWTDGACTGYLEAGATKHVHGASAPPQGSLFASNRAREGRLRGSGREVLCTMQPAGRLTQHGTLPSMPKLDCVA